MDFFAISAYGTDNPEHVRDSTLVVDGETRHYKMELIWTHLKSYECTMLAIKLSVHVLNEQKYQTGYTQIGTGLATMLVSRGQTLPVHTGRVWAREITITDSLLSMLLPCLCFWISMK